MPNYDYENLTGQDLKELSATLSASIGIVSAPLIALFGIGAALYGIHPTQRPESRQAISASAPNNRINLLNPSVLKARVQDGQYIFTPDIFNNVQLALKVEGGVGRQADVLGVEAEMFE